eukprot:73993-Chlamydomonas_euryale.AAC.3
MQAFQSSIAPPMQHRMQRQPAHMRTCHAHACCLCTCARQADRCTCNLTLHQTLTRAPDGSAAAVTAACGAAADSASAGRGERGGSARIETA